MISPEDIKRRKRNPILFRGTYAFYKEVGETEDGILFRYPAQLGSLGFLGLLPGAGICFASCWSLITTPGKPYMVMLDRTVIVIVGSLGLFLLILACSSLWTHRQFLFRRKERVLEFQYRSPFRNRRIVVPLSEIKAVCLTIDPKASACFVELLRIDGNRFDLGQGTEPVAMELSGRLSLLLGVPVIWN